MIEIYSAYIKLKENTGNDVLMMLTADSLLTFDSDAERLSKLAGLALSYREGCKTCSFPYRFPHLASRAVCALTDLGYVVAIAEQLDGQWQVVRRDMLVIAGQEVRRIMGRKPRVSILQVATQGDISMDYVRKVREEGAAAMRAWEIKHLVSQARIHNRLWQEYGEATGFVFTRPKGRCDMCGEMARVHFDALHLCPQHALDRIEAAHRAPTS